MKFSNMFCLVLENNNKQKSKKQKKASLCFILYEPKNNHQKFYRKQFMQKYSHLNSFYPHVHVHSHTLTKEL